MKSVKPSFDFWACVLALGLLLSLALAMHALSYREPYERDECVYAVVGREILRGRGLYTDVWDIKPPGIFLTYAAAIALFGYGRPPIFFLAVFADALTILGLFAAVKAATGNRLAALWCAALWTIVACSAELQANQPNSEVFLNALAIWAIWALFKGQTVEGSRQERLWLLGMGALWAIASYFKQVAVVPGLLFAVFAGIRWAGGRPKWSPGRSFLAIAPILGLWAVTALFFYVRGAWWDFVYVNFTFLRLYGHGFTWMEKQPFLFKVLPARVYFLWPLAVLNLAGLWAGLRARNRVWLAWALLCLGAEIEIYLPGQFFGHYYQLLVVPLALGAGLALDQLSEIKFMKRIPLWN